MTHPPDRKQTDLLIDHKALRDLSRPAPMRLIALTLFEWSCIVAVIALANRWGSILLNGCAVVLIATRQHALLMLMHEFSHRQFSRKHLILNDTLGDLLTAMPFFITIHGFRRNHMPHHRAPSTAKDPNWTANRKTARYHFPRSRLCMAWILFLHCIGAYAIQDVKAYLFGAQMATDLPRGVKLRQMSFVLVVILIAWVFNLGTILALYWIVPMLTVLMALLYIRDVGEHYGMPSSGLEASRTILTGPLESWLIAPHGVGFHAEHHLYPSVPFCRLPTLHKRLRSRPEYTQHAVVTQGYLRGLLDELSSAPTFPEPQTEH